MKKKSAQADITHIKDLKPDQRNARKHNPRNIGMIEDALHEVGAARSIVIDEEGNILAGNGTVEAAAQAGIERVKVVEADGEEIVAVRRRGLTAQQKRRLALFDNRTAETAGWDSGELEKIIAEDAKALEGILRESELNALIADAEIRAAIDAGGDDSMDSAFSEDGSAGKGKSKKAVKCPKCGQIFQPA